MYKFSSNNNNLCHYNKIHFIGGNMYKVKREIADVFKINENLNKYSDKEK